MRTEVSPVKVTADGSGCAQSILQREGIRQLPGICWYLTEGVICNGS